MPSKKSSHSHGADKDGKSSQPRPSSPLFKEGCDPLDTVVSIVEKRARNLSKRKDRLSALQKESDDGKSLDKDQLEAISKLPDVLVQIDFLHDMQKQFIDLNSEYRRLSKAKQKVDEQKRRDEEKLKQRASAQYCLRIQLMLEQLDDATKESFRSGSDGAAKLSDAELKQLDDFYTLVNPQRAGNPSFEQELSLAVQHMSLLHEESSIKVAGTTYKALNKVFGKINSCGFLDKEPPAPPVVEEEQKEEELVEEEELVVEEYLDLEAVPSKVADTSNTSYATKKDDLRQTTPTPIVGTTFGDKPVEPFHKQQVPTPISAPSPDFVGLGSSNMTSSLEFQFMRGDPLTPSAHPTPPSLPSMFNNTEETNVIVSSKQELGGGVDGQYVPETGQQMNEKSDLVGSPVVGTLTTDSTTDQSNGATYSSKPQGNGKLYDRRPPRPNGNNRQRPYNKSRESRGDGSGGYGGGANRGMGRPRSTNGGRGRPNYPFNRSSQNRSSNGPRPANNGTRQSSYASTAATQQS